MKKILFLAISSLFVFGVQAQIKAPQPSPTSKITQAVGLSEITIEYSRPGMKGRKIFGGLVPFNELWRTGANASTKLTFGENVKIAGQDLKKGTYALFTIPGEKEWTIIIHKNLEHWGTDDYKQEEDMFRFVAKPIALSSPVESFTMSVDNLKSGSCEITMSWEKTAVSIPVTLNTDEAMVSSIKKAMDGPSAGDYYAAARYYHEENKDAKQALDWVNKSLEKGGDKFWILRLKALLQAKNGDYAGAIATAEKSSELAKKEDNADYPRMNDESIKEWKTKK
ncbi:MAG: DUF2911 domain-containing protein [Saprospiraceae bacterium]